MYSQKWNCEASLFPKQNYNVLSPNFTLIYLWEIIYFQDWSVYFAAAKYVDRSWEYVIYKSGKWDFGRATSRKGIHKWDFCLQCELCTRLDRGRWAWWQTRWRARSRTRRRRSSASSWAGPATRRKDETSPDWGRINTAHNQTSDVIIWGWSLMHFLEFHVLIRMTSVICMFSCSGRCFIGQKK